MSEGRCGQLHDESVTATKRVSRVGSGEDRVTRYDASREPERHAFDLLLHASIFKFILKVEFFVIGLVFVNEHTMGRLLPVKFGRTPCVRSVL